MKRKNIFLLIILIIVIIIILSSIIDSIFVKISNFKIESSKIPKSFDGYKILQISDLHSKEFGEKNKRLIKKIENVNPDIIVMTGDMINMTDDNYDVFYNLANELAKKYKIYYVVGNHEQNLKEEKLKKITDYLQSINITVLDNQKIEINKNNEKINIYGLWYNLKYYKDVNNKYTKDIYFGQDQIKQILGEKEDGYTILLTHNPIYFDTYATWGADLTLAGHIHGGMIRLPFIGGLLSPERELFPKYDSGLYNLDDSKMIVNRGLGNGEVPIRIFNIPEISVITLNSK